MRAHKELGLRTEKKQNGANERVGRGMSRERGASRVAVRVHPGTHPHRRPMARLQLPKRLDEGGGHQNCLRCRRRFSGTIPCKKHMNPRTQRSAQPLDVDGDSLAPPCPLRSGGWRCACGCSGAPTRRCAQNCFRHRRRTLNAFRPSVGGTKRPTMACCTHRHTWERALILHSQNNLILSAT